MLKQAQWRGVFSPPFLYGTVLIFYFCVWSFANWPALTTAWWSTDDYAVTTYHDNMLYMLRGRPVEGVIHLTLLLETGTYGWLVNMIARYGQGVLHCLTAVTMAHLLYKQTRQLAAFVVLLLFVIWPLNGEAVLWRVSVISSSAFLAVIGVYCIARGIAHTNRLLQTIGVGTIILAFLAHQLGAFAGFVVWFLQTALDKDFNLRTRGREFVTIVMAYLLGAICSIAMIRYFFPDLGRATLATNWQEKIGFAFELNDRFLNNDIYSDRILVLHWSILAAASFLLVVIMAGNFGGRRILALRQSICLFFLLFLPYAPLLVILESWSSPRNLYLGPFLLIGACLIVITQVTDYRFNALVILIVMVLTISYLPLSQQNAAEYVYVFQEDRLTLTVIEAHVQEHKQELSGEIAVASAPDYVRSWNLYNVQLWGDAKGSAYMLKWAAKPFIQQFSWLKVIDEPAIQNSCVNVCRRDAQGQPFYMSTLPSSQVLCVCP